MPSRILKTMMPSASTTHQSAPSSKAQTATSSVVPSNNTPTPSEIAHPHDEELNQLDKAKLDGISRTNLHVRDTMRWLKSRHGTKAKLQYLFFPEELHKHYEINELFRGFDIDHSEGIEISELISMFKDNHVLLDRQDIQAIFNLIDFNGDNTLNLSEFKKSVFSDQINTDFAKLMRSFREKLAAALILKKAAKANSNGAAVVDAAANSKGKKKKYYDSQLQLVSCPTIEKIDEEESSSITELISRNKDGLKSSSNSSVFCQNSNHQQSQQQQQQYQQQHKNQELIVTAASSTSLDEQTTTRNGLPVSLGHIPLPFSTATTPSEIYQAKPNSFVSPQKTKAKSKLDLQNPAAVMHQHKQQQQQPSKGASTSEADDEDIDDVQRVVPTTFASMVEFFSFNFQRKEQLSKCSKMPSTSAMQKAVALSKLIELSSKYAHQSLNKIQSLQQKYNQDPQSPMHQKQSKQSLITKPQTKHYFTQINNTQQSKQQNQHSNQDNNNHPTILTPSPSTSCNEITPLNTNQQQLRYSILKDKRSTNTFKPTLNQQDKQFPRSLSSSLSLAQLSTKSLAGISTATNTETPSRFTFNHRKLSSNQLSNTSIRTFSETQLVTPIKSFKTLTSPRSNSNFDSSKKIEASATSQQLTAFSQNSDKNFESDQHSQNKKPHLEWLNYSMVEQSQKLKQTPASGSQTNITQTENPSSGMTRKFLERMERYRQMNAFAIGESQQEDERSEVLKQSYINFESENISVAAPASRQQSRQILRFPTTPAQSSSIHGSSLSSTSNSFFKKKAQRIDEEYLKQTMRRLRCSNHIESTTCSAAVAEDQFDYYQKRTGTIAKNQNSDVVEKGNQTPNKSHSLLFSHKKRNASEPSLIQFIRRQLPEEAQQQQQPLNNNLLFKSEMQSPFKLHEKSNKSMAKSETVSMHLMSNKQVADRKELLMKPYLGDLVPGISTNNTTLSSSVSTSMHGKQFSLSQIGSTSSIFSLRKLNAISPQINTTPSTNALRGSQSKLSLPLKVKLSSE